MSWEEEGSHRIMFFRWSEVTHSALGMLLWMEPVCSSLSMRVDAYVPSTCWSIPLVKYLMIHKTQNPPIEWLFPLSFSYIQFIPRFRDRNIGWELKLWAVWEGGWAINSVFIIRDATSSVCMPQFGAIWQPTLFSSHLPELLFFWPQFNLRQIHANGFR